MVCSAMCAESSRSNWQKKKDEGTEPGKSMFQEAEIPDVIEDNLDLE